MPEEDAKKFEKWLPLIEKTFWTQILFDIRVNILLYIYGQDSIRFKWKTN